MKQYEYWQVDAFTQTPLHGNPCAIVFNAEGLSDAQMFAIAREANQSETVFVLKSNAADFKFRFFTPAEELPLAGHPTIATVHALRERGQIAATQSQVHIELGAGVVSVALGPNGAISMQQLPPQFMQTYAPASIMPCFGLIEADVLSGAVIQTVSTGTPMLMVPLASQTALQRAVLNPMLFTQCKNIGDYYSAHLFCLQGFTEQGQTSARHFCAPPDVMEDAFTGSATGAMACYLWHHNLIAQPSFTAEQGHGMHRPGQGVVTVAGLRHAITGVTITGHAVTVLKGQIGL